MLILIFKIKTRNHSVQNRAKHREIIYKNALFNRLNVQVYSNYFIYIIFASSLGKLERILYAV